MDENKLHDTITGLEDIGVRVGSRYEDEHTYIINEDGKEEYTGTKQVEKPFYYIGFETEAGIQYYYNEEIEEFCNMRIDEYIKVLRAHGGRYYNNMDCYVFENKEDVEAVLDELAPYIVMAKLSANNRKTNIDKLMERDVTEDDGYWEDYSQYYADGRDVYGDEEPII